ncbi:hypothetical protein B0G82_7495 [Paraburkholderia sp. BL17N1]|nr:hypothetical protein B0G82_7495 [Paraburkholderia sp. BL17N1]
MLWHALLQGYDIEPASSLARATRWFVLARQIRVTEWLIDCCALSEHGWNAVWKTQRIATCDTTGSPKALASS